jgi:hypothetical protein
MNILLTIPSSAEEILQNAPVWRLIGGGLPSSRLVTCPRELNITFEPISFV